MPRFFLHIRGNGQGRSDDECGLDFPNVETARSEVVRAAQELEHIFVARDQDPRDYAIEIERDRRGSFLPAVLRDLEAVFAALPRDLHNCRPRWWLADLLRR
jgi:hypothetical protein